PCAMLWNLALSPRAFWMSALMPAAANALLSAGRSAVSQRVEDWVSGRITPTVPPAAGALDAGAAGADDAGAAGALVAVAGADVAAAGALVAAAGALEAGGAEVFLLLLQPAIPSPATAATAMSLIAVLFMHGPLFAPGRRTWCPTGLPSCCAAQHMHRGPVNVRATEIIFVFGMDLLHRRDPAVHAATASLCRFTMVSAEPGPSAARGRRPSRLLRARRRRSRAARPATPGGR